jgi:hypothetical protein
MDKQIYVYLSFGEKENVLAGILWFHSRGDRKSASFEYHKDWLASNEHFAFEHRDMIAELKL